MPFAELVTSFTEVLAFWFESEFSCFKTSYNHKVMIYKKILKRNGGQ